MIRFKLNSVHDNWEVIAIVGSPDDIYFDVLTEQFDPITNYAALRYLIKLYECSLDEIPSSTHPLQGGFPLYERNDSIEIEVTPYSEANTHPVETNYAELRHTLVEFLGDVFQALDEKSTPEQHEAGIEYLAARDDLRHDFRQIYRRLVKDDES